LAQIKLDAAGLDIGASESWACVAADRDEASVRCFKPLTLALHALADWLADCGITPVVMESTGISWMPLDEMLERRGMVVCLVNAQATQHGSGRKRDLLDCQSLQQGHTAGL
jgi:hypothetical protein